MTASGFDAMGRPVPMERRAAALEALRQMLPGIGTERAMAIVGGAAQRLERDQPYDAMRAAGDAGLDLTGQYRLLAHLLAGPS